MTFKTKAIALGSAAGVLLLILILGEVLSPQRLARAGAEALLLPGFPASSASKIELTAGAARVLLSRDKDWTLQQNGVSYPAASAKVGFLLEGLAGLQKGTLVTRGGARDPDLGLSKDQALRLVVSDAKGVVLCDLAVGKTGAAGRGRYIRSGKSAEVFDTGESLSPYASAERQFWSDLKILPAGLSAEAVIRVRVKSTLILEGGKKPRLLDYTLISGQDKAGKPEWTFTGGAPASLEAVKKLIGTILSLEGSDFDTSSPGGVAAVQASAAATITITFSDSNELAVSFGRAAAGGSQYPCVLSGGRNVYLVPEWRVDQALAARETLNPPAR
jgi:hypothetical protein